MGSQGQEFVVAGLEPLGQVAGPQGLGLVDEVDAGLVDGHGVQRGQNAHVRADAGVGEAHAVAVGRNIGDEADVQAGLGALQQHCGRVLDHALQEGGHVGFPVDLQRAGFAGQEAGPAAYAARVVEEDVLLLQLARNIGQGERMGGAHAHAGAAAHAFVHVDQGAGGDVLEHFALLAGGAHADVLERAAKARQFVPLGVVDGHKKVGVGDVRRDEGLGEVLALDG